MLGAMPMPMDETPPAERPLDPTRTTPPGQILATLAGSRSRIPTQALEHASQHRAGLTPLLLARLQESLGGGGSSETPDLLTGYAVVLLAQWREPQAFDFLVAVARLPAARQEKLAGSTFLGDLAKLLAATAAGRVDSISDLVLDRSVPVTGRRAGVDALLHLVAWGEVPPADGERRLETWMTQVGAAPRELWLDLATAAFALQSPRLAAPLELAVNSGWLTDEALPGSLDYLRSLAGPIPLPAEALPPIRNAGALCFRWPWFQSLAWIEVPDRTPQASPASRSRPGRNDPCPCGSGLKFKKCCAGRAGAS